MTGGLASAAAVASPLRESWARVTVALERLGAAVEAADWDGAAAGNRELQGGLEAFDAALAAHRDDLSPDHVLSLIAALRGVVERHARYTTVLQAARNALASELAAARDGRSAAQHYLEAAGA